MSFPNQSAKANSIPQSKQKVMKFAKKDKMFLIPQIQLTNATFHLKSYWKKGGRNTRN